MRLADVPAVSSDACDLTTGRDRDRLMLEPRFGEDVSDSATDASVINDKCCRWRFAVAPQGRARHQVLHGLNLRRIGKTERQALQVPHMYELTRLLRQHAGAGVTLPLSV